MLQQNNPGQPLPLPPTCFGCPLAGKAKYFTPDYYNPDSNILLLAQNPGEHEENGRLIDERIWHNGEKEDLIELVEPQPLIGPTGKWIAEDFWPLTKLGGWRKVSKANVIKCRPNGSNDLPTIKSKELRQAIAHCTHAHFHPPASTQFILAMGVVSWYALTGMQSLNDTHGSYRGYAIGSEGQLLGKGTLYGIAEYYHPMPAFTPWTILPTIHPAALFKDDRYHHATRCDFHKFGELVRGNWPSQPLPEITLAYPDHLSSPLGFDTEYAPEDNNRLIMWSLSDTQGHIWVVKPHQGKLVLPTPNDITLFTQNGLVDIPYIANATTGIYKTLEDIMFMHSVLHTGEPHDLDYILSCHGSFNRHKHLSTYAPEFYAGLDAYTTLNHAGRAMIAEFKKDPLSWHIYRKYRQPLLSIIAKNQQHGMAIWHERVDQVRVILERNIANYKAEAQLLTQNEKFNLGSHQQVGRILYPKEEEIS